VVAGSNPAGYTMTNSIASELHCGRCKMELTKIPSSFVHTIEVIGFNNRLHLVWICDDCDKHRIQAEKRLLNESRRYWLGIE
jgi:hypothetical protein